MATDKGKQGGEFRRFALLLIALSGWLVVQAVLPEGGWSAAVRVAFIVICWGVAVWWFWS
ncbi:hypothetical protein [Janibacter sp. LM]|uniref:hypothetical protein n=1 Tax=Janibacter sp. LM TaxID=3144845 RepID=UPI0031F6597B